jgi:hypothetical protein
MGSCFGKPVAFRGRSRMARVYPTQDWNAEQKALRKGGHRKKMWRRRYPGVG